MKETTRAELLEWALRSPTGPPTKPAPKVRTDRPESVYRPPLPQPKPPAGLPER